MPKSENVKMCACGVDKGSALCRYKSIEVKKESKLDTGNEEKEEECHRGGF